MSYSTIFPARFTAAKRNKIEDLSGFSGPVRNLKNACIGAKFFDKTFLGGCDECLSLIGEIFEQFADAFVVKLGVNIVNQKERIFATCGVKDGDVRELQKEQCRALLAGGAKLPQIMCIKGQLHVVTMRADESMTCDKLGLNTQLEPLGDQLLIGGEIALSLE